MKTKTSWLKWADGLYAPSNLSTWKGRNRVPTGYNRVVDLLLYNTFNNLKCGPSGDIVNLYRSWICVGVWVKFSIR